MIVLGFSLVFAVGAIAGADSGTTAFFIVIACVLFYSTAVTVFLIQRGDRGQNRFG